MLLRKWIIYRYQLMVTLFVVLLSNGGSATSHEFNQNPPEAAKKQWRLAYYEGGDYSGYRDYLVATVKGLMELGWIEPVDIPKIGDTRSLWAWLATNIKSEFILFDTTHFYSANWDQKKRHEIRSELIHKLTHSSNIDMVFALGTWAGQDLVNNEHSTPTFIMSASDPIKSGIIRSVDDSGYDHIFAKVSPQHYEQQIELFYELIKFKKLGIAYENSENGRTYAALDSAIKVAKAKHFEIVSCYTESDIVDQRIANASVISCINQLSQEVDALYITEQGGVNDDSIPTIVSIANENRVATLSQLGEQEVAYGMLMSVSRSEYDAVGLFMAGSVGKVINGAKPRDLNQIFEEKNNIAINLKTANIIGTYIYANWLAVADKIYKEISLPGRVQP